MTTTTLWERLHAKYVVDDATGCWIWTAAFHKDGYGHIRVDGRSMLAHRVAYELHVGLIPEGLTLDHLCRERACVNPAHLEPVTHRENCLRGEGACARKARQESCVHGHPFDEVNTYIRPDGGRRCRACDRDREKRRMRNRRREVTAHITAEANKTLAGIIDELDAMKEAALALDMESVLENGGESNFISFSQSLQAVKATLAMMTLTLVVAQAIMAGEKPGESD